MTPTQRTGFALDTVISVSIYDAPNTVDTEAVLDACFNEVERLESLFSATREQSDISRINQAAGQPVTVSRETVTLLQQGLRYAQLSEGIFDITMRPVTQLWNFTTSPKVPDAGALAEAVRQVDYRHLSVEGTTVVLSEGAIELGGIAKGYIADCLRDLLTEAGVTSALIDLGGNIVACGSKRGEAWRIGIKDPQKPERLCAVVTGTDVSVVTSGIYERGFTENNLYYHHLLSSTTGMPVQNELASVTVVCHSSTQADALSTTCFLMGESRARAFIESMDGVELLFVHRDGSITATEGLQYTLDVA